MILITTSKLLMLIYKTFSKNDRKLLNNIFLYTFKGECEFWKKKIY